MDASTQTETIKTFTVIIKDADVLVCPEGNKRSYERLATMINQADGQPGVFYLVKQHPNGSFLVESKTTEPDVDGDNGDSFGWGTLNEDIIQLNTVHHTSEFRRYVDGRPEGIWTFCDPDNHSALVTQWEDGMVIRETNISFTRVQIENP
ncbi:MAG: hypothetical protein ACYCQJ_15850 [Nitrososphaerales archaeon]